MQKETWPKSKENHIPWKHKTKQSYEDGQWKCGKTEHNLKPKIIPYLERT